MNNEHSVSGYCSMDISDEELITDCESSLKQLDILRMLTMSTDSDVGFSKVSSCGTGQNILGYSLKNLFWFLCFCMFANLKTSQNF